MARIASATLRPCDTKTSTCRSLATISSGLCPFFAISVLLRLEAIPQDGPLHWGRITEHRATRKAEGPEHGTVGEAAGRPCLGGEARSGRHRPPDARVQDTLRCGVQELPRTVGLMRRQL